MDTKVSLQKVFNLRFINFPKVHIKFIRFVNASEYVDPVFMQSISDVIKGWVLCVWRKPTTIPLYELCSVLASFC